MSEVNGISNIEQKNDYNIKAAKTSKAGSPAFSTYLEETKSMDEIFERAAKKYEVPVNLLKAIGKAESGFDAKAVSRSGAQGVMQLMPATAASLGVTDSFDPEQNIMGGSKYIAELLKKYDGDTSLALAAYNAGMGNVKKYGGIPPFKETQNYVVKVTKFMKENLEAGNTTVAAANSAPVQLSPTKAPISPISANMPVNWYLKPSEQTQVSSSEDISEVLNSIFSYQDYLKFLDLFMNSLDDKEQTEQSFYFGR